MRVRNTTSRNNAPLKLVKLHRQFPSLRVVIECQMGSRCYRGRLYGTTTVRARIFEIRSSRERLPL
ncbi:hypothetical protein FOXG_21510 [Fusarium oxysporum f. sp. lycopersici 4287]|uniref:Uncharacterized protein n=1 Tax=Fusarium oxysporum f. sp. lycopersici (strain 4287 / CBS 123668 / FGSC 9935 / NRRL 34936) TaxID=426428 RepID=A0A0J9WTD7_FUSO4|nr:hypothetical protein FOXG_21510 [Fusarium oxysporum f. sp. lycopersici 4287]KNB15852.1 hypothetical protein FOXG_21510 [Fusarium oxysporum f. sp. lycopersici 4287]